MKFSDPNYQMLSEYFDILVAESVSTDKSVLIGPQHTVASQGGLYTILYEDNSERGFVGHRFQILEINGNRFKMEYKGLNSTHSLASSAFDIGNDMYFRKDSFFHYWIARQTQDDRFHNYCNQKRTFLFFGKIWPDSSANNVYNIQFEGLKDYTLDALPQHNQTVNMTEWLKVYWDQIHHEIYNMTKTSWSLFDAREIDIRWLAYIAQIYGIEISEEILNELPLREWVENLPHFLKRIGTYNALYIIWKIFLSNTSNKLNIYEKWGEWCTQSVDRDLGDVVDSFEDHNMLEFYGVQPSGGSGNFYYSRFDPNSYPNHSIESPSGDCGTVKWDIGNSENYLLFNYRNLNCSVGDITENSIEITEYDPTRYSTQVMYLSAASPSYDSNFTHSIGIEMSSTIPSASSSNIVFWALSNELSQMFDHTGYYISLSFETSASNRFFRIVESPSGSSPSSIKSTFSYQADTPYYLVIDRTNLNLRVRTYSRERRWAEDLLETINLVLSSVESFTYLYVLNSRRIIGHDKWSGKIYKISQTNTLTNTIATSGFPIITPHYKVQIDLSTEPLGDIFDNDSIITQGIISELVRNWEYVRPVNKYSHYEELISPIGKIDRVGGSSSLYNLTSNGYMNTFFTGAQYLSGGGDSLGIEYTFSHYQQFASKTWNVSHNLNSPYVIVQPWVFKGASSNGAKIVQPNNVSIINNNSLQLTFNESVKGVAAVASSGASGIGYVENTYASSPSASWKINHNLDLNVPSGWGNPVGPVICHWKGDDTKIIPNSNDIIDQDSIKANWDSSFPLSGHSIVRRSNYIHNQYDTSNIWTVNHNLNSWVIVQCYDIVGTDEISPNEIKLIDQNSFQVFWNENKRGYVHVIQVSKDKIVYSPYDCDYVGLGICPDVLGYWKVGTGTDTLWNPFVENDLESPITSGTYLRIDQDVNNIYVDFVVSSDFKQDINIREIGLFNYLDQLMLYSRCSDFYRPDGIDAYFHYRIGKLESSSSLSSSSSSSVSSSSSSISSS